MEEKFLIRNEETMEYLAHIYLGRKRKIPALRWTKYKSAALQFDTDEEVRSVVDFIVNMINWELEDQLTIC